MVSANNYFACYLGACEMHVLKMMFPLEVYFIRSFVAQWSGARLLGLPAPPTSGATLGNSLSVSLCPWL